jgi:hypothetical protein
VPRLDQRRTLPLDRVQPIRPKVRNLLRLVPTLPGRRQRITLHILTLLTTPDPKPGTKPRLIMKIDPQSTANMPRNIAKKQEPKGDVQRAGTLLTMAARICMADAASLRIVSTEVLDAPTSSGLAIRS